MKWTGIQPGFLAYHMEKFIRIVGCGRWGQQLSSISVATYANMFVQKHERLLCLFYMHNDIYICIHIIINYYQNNLLYLYIIGSKMPRLHLKSATQTSLRETISIQTSDGWPCFPRAAGGIPHVQTYRCPDPNVSWTTAVPASVALSSTHVLCSIYSFPLADWGQHSQFVNCIY